MKLRLWPVIVMKQSLSRQVLIASFILALFIVVFSSLFWLYSSAQIRHELEQIRDRYEISELLHTMSDASRMRALSTHRMYLMDDLFDRLDEQETFQNYASIFMSARNQLLAHPAFNEQDRESWDITYKLVNDGAVLHNNIVASLIAEDTLQAMQILKRDSKQVQDKFIRKFNETLAIKNEEIHAIVRQAEERSHGYFKMLVFIAATSIVMIITIFIYAFKYIATSEKTLRKAHELEKIENEYKTDFLSRLSHELRTPLNSILGFAQVINMDKGNKLSIEYSNYVKNIEQSGWQLLKLVDSIVEITRIYEGKVTLDLAEINIKELLNSCCHGLEEMARRYEVNCEFHIDENLADYIETDGTRFRQIMENLISNAIKYNHPSGRVYVEVQEEKGQFQITVTNTGPGIPPEFLNMLFKPFSKVGELNKEDGRGVGLVLTKALVEFMGGTIEVDSVPDKETTFRVKLPLAHIRAA